MVKKQKNMTLNRRDAFIRLLLVLVIILLANIVSKKYYYRLDLTAEKRYSISQPSKDLVKNLKDVVQIEVYLSGDLNAGFRRLQESVRNTLKEFQAYAGSNMEFEFIDLVNMDDKDLSKAKIKFLIDQGLHPIDLTTKAKTGSSNQLIFPFALIKYQGRTLAVDLLEKERGATPEDAQDALNNSATFLEYKFANAIDKLTRYRAPRVAFARGNGELGDLETVDIRQTLTDLKYEVDTFNLKKNYHVPENYDVLVIAKPSIPFDDKDKFKIDQFIMRGGRVLWLVEGSNANMDSLVKTGEQLALGVDLNLDDMLFKYGVRINNDVVQDINLYSQISVVTRIDADGNPQTELKPWYYFPLLVSDNNHAIVRNIDPVAAYFASTIDTVKNQPAVSKTILLHTTDNARAQMAPTRVSIDIMRRTPEPAYYNQPRLPIAVLLEGSFQSVFKNRMSPEYLQATDTVGNLKYIDSSAHNKMIVIADGDIIRNDVLSSGKVYKLGFDRFTGQQYANKDFILNCIDYLADDKNLLATKNKEIRMRLLDTIKVENEKLKWQLLNIALPVLLVILFGLLFGFLRKRRYAK